MSTRRHCSACRLNKCFEQGMKKELIRSLAAINQASSAMMITTQYHSEQAVQRRTTTTTVNLFFVLACFVHVFVLDGFNSCQ